MAKINYQNLTENKLISNIKKTACNESLKELTERHSGIIYNIGKKFCSNSNFDLNDLDDNKYWLIFKSVMSFDPKKGSKFSTWLANQVRFFCLNTKNKLSKLIPLEDSFLEFYINEKSKQDSDKKNKKVMINNIIDLFNEISDPNTKKAVYYRYFYNKDRILNYSEIANILKVTPQTVLNWHNKFINFAKKKLTN